MKSYVVGYMFDNDMKRVVMARKRRPEWQAGLLNGVGGHIEPHEIPVQAMVREFIEETGHGIISELWTHTITLMSDDVSVYYFKAVGDVSKPQTMTDEEILVVNVSDILELDVVRNVAWTLLIQRDSNLTIPVIIRDSGLPGEG